METIDYRVEGGIAHVTLARPASLNAISKQLSTELATTMDEAESDPDVRVVLLSGQGRSFCAGADLKDPTMHAADDIVGQLAVDRGNGSGSFVGACTKPVVAAIQGWAVGGGTEMVIAADIAVADETARFFLSQVGLGILPGGGGVARLVRAVGPEWASRMVLFGEHVDADTALRIGLVSEVTPAGAHIDRAVETASTIASMPPAAVRLAKQAITTSTDVPLHDALVADNYKLFVLSATPEKEVAHAAFSIARGRTAADA
jgi:enoyl-CoA hydratase/carnithine racemase